MESWNHFQQHCCHHTPAAAFQRAARGTSCGSRGRLQRWKAEILPLASSKTVPTGETFPQLLIKHHPPPSQRASFFWRLTAFPWSSMPSRRGGGEQAGDLGLEEARRELATARGTRGRGCLVTGISHSSSSIVHTVTGRKELDWTSPDWNKPLLPSPLFTTPTSPPAPLPPTFIQGRIMGKCSVFRDKNPAAGEGRRSRAGLPPSRLAHKRPNHASD